MVETNMTYLKITNSEENHKGLQYKTGLIEDILPFEKEGSCVPGGIYFSDEKNICNFLSYGVWIREVSVPSDAEMVKDPKGDKWRASKVILGERKSLSEVSTLEWLISIGVDINKEEILIIASSNGDLELVKYLVSLGADIHILNEYALRLASRHGCLDVVKYLVSVGVDIHDANESALKWAVANGHLEVVKYLVSLGADIHVNNGEPFRWASGNKQFEIVNFLESCK
jgi:hypothetical protein